MNKSEFRLSVIALVVAVGTAAFTYLQYRVADHARQEIHDDAMQTMRLGYRPYVAARATLDPKTKPFGIRAEVTLQFTASGASPALDMVFRHGCRMTPSAVARGMSPPKDLWDRMREAMPHGVLFPGQNLALHCEISPVTDDSSPVPSGAFVVGDVAYTDVFRQSHKTSFCFYTFKPEAPGDMYPCTQGNAME
jgi:hypothetical protein